MENLSAAHPNLTIALALAFGIFAQSIARHLYIPGIVLLLALGAILGPDFLHWIDPSALGDGLFAIVDLAVAVILFEGGMNLDISRLRRSQLPIRRLVTWGPLITLLGGSYAAHYFLNWDWQVSLLFGSLVVVTGPTVISPLVRELRLRHKVATVLEAEGVLIDPVGALLAVLVLDIVISPQFNTLTSGLTDLTIRFGSGALIGIIAGILLAGILKVKRLIPEGYENIFSLSFVILLFHLSDLWMSQTGILSVTFAGITLGNIKTRVSRDLKEFKDQITVLLIGLLFILLAANVRIDDIIGLGSSGLFVVASLILIVRPANVFFATLGSKLLFKERIFISWIAPRGIVAAAVTALIVRTMNEKGIPHGNELIALVFLTIIGTVLLAGLTARPIAFWLKLQTPGREKVAILGAQGLGLVIAKEFREAEIQVVFLDSNPHQCRRAEEAGFQVVYGNALEEKTLARARFEQVGTAIGLTPNENLNTLFLDHTKEEFSVPNRFIALEEAETGITKKQIEKRDAKVLFDKPHDVERWDVRYRHNDMDVIYVEHTGQINNHENLSQSSVEEPYVFLLIRRGKKIILAEHAMKFKKGDRASVAVYKPEKTLILTWLKSIGWGPLT